MTILFLSQGQDEPSQPGDLLCSSLDVGHQWSSGHGVRAIYCPAAADSQISGRDMATEQGQSLTQSSSPDMRNEQVCEIVRNGNKNSSVRTFHDRKILVK